MQKLLINGKKELSGKISISGSKNATLPILAATILSHKAKLTNIPLVRDIFTMVELLKFIGLKTNILKNKNTIEITFVSKSFLQQQVRSMVGCLKYLGEKKWSLGKFKQVMLSKSRANCAPPAPAHGLYLFKVNY